MKTYKNPMGREAIQVTALPESSSTYSIGELFMLPSGNLYRVAEGRNGLHQFRRMTSVGGKRLLAGESRWAQEVK